MPLGYSESDYKKPICKVRVECTRSLASKYKVDTEPVSQLHLEHYISITQGYYLVSLNKQDLNQDMQGRLTRGLKMGRS